MVLEVQQNPTFPGSMPCAIGHWELLLLPEQGLPPGAELETSEKPGSRSSTLRD